MRFMVNIDGLADGRDTYFQRIYTEQEDKRGFLKRLGEKKSKIDNVEAVTIIRDDILEEAKSGFSKNVSSSQSKTVFELASAVVKEEAKEEIKTKMKFKCKICNEEFDSGVKVGKHKKEKHPEQVLA